MDQKKAGRTWAESVLKQIEKEKQEFEKEFAALDDRDMGILVCEGDSWFDYRPGSNRDILKWLRKRHNYDVREANPNGGDRLLDIAYNPDQLAGVYECLEEIAYEGKEPRAILLSGGGNDMTKKVLAYLLNHKKSGEPPINEAMTDAFINDRLRGALQAWVSAIDVVCERLFENTFPVFVHGYSYPVPDGDKFGWNVIKKFPGPWLKPAFQMMGYWGEEDNPRDEDEALQETTQIMENLIGRFNAMLKAESDRGSFHYLNFQEKLSNDLNDYDIWWANELHPEKGGWQAIAEELSKQLEETLLME